MVWIKRLFFALGIIIVLSGHFVWNKFTDYREQKQARKFAMITAQTWIAGAKFNYKAEEYLQYRDSLLKSEKITKEEINEYLSEYQKAPEKYIYFATLVSYYVDSLAAVEDTLLKVNPVQSEE